MSQSSRSRLLTELSWADVDEHIARDSRLIVPVGACDQYGPHLPIGAGTLLAEAVALELAQDFGVLRAPTLPYGVNLPSEHPFSGTAGLHPKNLTRLLNDLLASWEDHGFTEFILVTAHRYDPHVEAIATVTGTTARIRAVEVLGIDLADFLDGPGGREHGGEVMTSLMLHLYPERVNMARARDYRPPGYLSDRTQRLKVVPADSPGSIGEPTLATAEKGGLIFERILQRVRAKVFLAAEEAELR
jgi:creatinine amidohydrolase/Fe(II)-dependent formamide hydrolase-like protein